MNKKTANKITIVVTAMANHCGGDLIAEKSIGQADGFTVGPLSFPFEFE